MLMIQKINKGLSRLSSGLIGLFVLGLSATAQQLLPTAYSGYEPVNYVRTWDAVRPQSSPDSFTISTPAHYARVTTQYLDGLGRPIQTVVKQGSLPTGETARDMVSAIVYDPFSREQYKYLPFAANNTGGNTSISDGLFKFNPFHQDSVFSKAQYPGETHYYGQTVFEASPLSRGIETFAPGNSWAGTVGQANEADRRSVKVKYRVNTVTDSVRIWNVEDVPGSFGTYSTGAAYPAGELYKNITADEHGKQVIEFKDKTGLVILKKVQLTGQADTGTGKGYYGWLSTYYLYDSLNQLRCVIQPEGVKLLATSSWLFTTTLLKEQCFRYEYDYQGRMITKKIPGAGEVYMVYDERDRLVMSQDANLRETGEWLVSKYDGLNRPTETGLWTNATAISTHRVNAGTSIAYPTTSSNYEKLTVTHYDDYEDLPDGWSSSFDNSWSSHFYSSYNVSPLYVQQQAASSMTKGLVTWTQARILGTNTFLSSVNIYDEKGRVIQVKSTTALGTDIITTQYDWSGKPLVTVQAQTVSATGGQATVVVSKLSYDELGRMVKTEKKLGNTNVSSNAMSDYVTVSTLAYDALGQVKTKGIGSKKDAATNEYLAPREPLETLNHDYNIRGWLVGMNRDFIKDEGTAKFGFELTFDKRTSIKDNYTANTYTKAQYNGNIGGMIWKSIGDGEKRKYDFDYDAANRLLKADFTQYTGGWNTNAGINFCMGGDTTAGGTMKYDANGNILEMWQKGLKLTSSDWVDKLSYTYFTASNRLKDVTDGITTDNKLGDFTDKHSSSTDYGYDKNGNLVTDLNKRIGSTAGSDVTSGGAISYNHLNMPIEIQVKDDAGNSKGKITYTYDADGNKLRKETAEYASTANNNITTTTITDYVSGFIYESRTDDNGSTTDYSRKLQFLDTEEGRIRYKDSLDIDHPAAFEYDYMIKDHLGNVRMVLTEETKTDGYLATIESGQRSSEEQLFTNIPETEESKPAGFDSDGDNQKVSKLLCRTNEDKRIGPGVVLKVMAGDKFRAGVQGWYQPDVTNPTPGPAAIPMVEALINAFTGGLPAGGNHGQGSGHSPGSTELTSPLQDFIDNNNPSPPGIIPKAYLNWILLDEEQFKLVNGNYGSVQIPEITDTMEKQLMLANGGADMEIKKNGYLYVYVSNESKGSVYFDDLAVTHIRGSLLEETHYYPFGLTMAGISSKALIFGFPENKKNKFQNQEFNNDLGVDYYEFKYRSHDPQIGRFIQVDPLSEKYVYNSTFAFSENRVTSSVEIEGLESKDLFFELGPIREHREKYGLPKVESTGEKVLQANLVVLGTLVTMGAAELIPGAGLLSGALKANKEETPPTAATGKRNVPNPNGKKGGDLHQKTIDDVEQDMQSRGLETKREVKIETPGGNKNTRYVDLEGKDPKTGAVEQVQVGKQNKNGTPVSREKKALDDIENATGQRPAFKAYNSTKTTTTTTNSNSTYNWNGNVNNR